MEVFIVKSPINAPFSNYRRLDVSESEAVWKQTSWPEPPDDVSNGANVQEHILGGIQEEAREDCLGNFAWSGVSKKEPKGLMSSSWNIYLNHVGYTKKSRSFLIFLHHPDHHPFLGLKKIESIQMYPIISYIISG